MTQHTPSPPADQRVGEPVEATPVQRPQRTPLRGTCVDVMPLQADTHGDDLYAAAMAPGTDPSWTYLSFGPWTERASFDTWLGAFQAAADRLAFALVDKSTGKALGLCSYARIDPANRVIEIGSVWYSPALQRTRAATEAMYLMARHVFEDLGYRRYEWKCNSFNEPSRRTAERLGFTYEGLFRQHMISRGRNRDTAWFSMLDSEWPARKRAFERWLDADNFDADGRQRRSLAAVRAEGAAG